MMRTFPRIGGESAVFDAVTVTFRNGHYVATARRDDIRATVRTGYDTASGPATASEQATAVAWLARVAMADKWRDEGSRRGVADIATATHAEWTDPARYAVSVSVEVPGHAYVVTFIPRGLVGMRELTPTAGRRVRFPYAHPGETFVAADPANGIYTRESSRRESVQINHDATRWEYAR